MQDLESRWSQLMRDAKAGHETSYTRFLEAAVPFLRQVVRRAGIRDRCEVEDVVQDTLLSIHLKRHTWDVSRPIVPWIRAIARNKVVDHLRRRGYRTYLPLDDLADLLPAPQREAQIMGTEIAKLLSALHSSHRKIVMAIAIDGLTIAEVAALEQKTAGAVRVALHRGLKALAAAIAKREP